MLVGELIVLAIFLVIGVVALAQGKGRGFDFTPDLQLRHLLLVAGVRRGLHRGAVASSASTASRCWPRRTRSRPAQIGRAMVAALLLAGVLFIVQTWVAALLVPDPAGSDRQGRPRRHRVLRRRRRRRRRAGWPTLTALATAIAWGFANSLVAQAATSPAALRDGPRPAAAVVPGQGPPDARASRPTRPCWSRPSRWCSGLYMAARDDGITLLSHAGQLRCADRVPGPARLGGRGTTSSAAAAATGGAHLVAPVDRLRDPRSTW